MDCTDFIERLLEGMIAQPGGEGEAGPYHYLVGWFRQASGGRTEPQVRQLLRELGATSRAHIRDLVQNAWSRAADAPPERREEVAALLHNLARRARGAAAGAGTTGDVERLLDGLRPRRRAGQPAGDGWADWVLDRFLGSGSSGEVWLGRNARQPGARHAFKFFTDAAARQWLRRELPTLIDVRQRLGRQPNVVDLVGVAAGGPAAEAGGPAGSDPFEVLEYVGGGSLEDWLLEAPDRRPALRKHEVMRGVVRALAAAHERGVYHGRLTPAGVLLTEPPDVQAKVAGFGLAGVASGGLGAPDAAPGEPPGGAARGRFGGPARAEMYWPPEAGELTEPAGWRDPGRWDVFAVGVSWYQLVVERLERPPYDFAEALGDRGQDGQTIRVIGQCLARPGRRFASAVELERALPDDLPAWSPPPAGFLDVSHLVREYLGTTAG